jgi:hypothetical protein
MTIYGCYNKPRPIAGSPVIAQDGYKGAWDPRYASITRSRNWITVPYAMSTECQYTKQHAADPHCSGCVHRARKTP